MKNIFACVSALLLLSSPLILPLHIDAEEAQYEFFGRHLVSQYYDCDVKAMNNTKRLTNAMKRATILSGASLLKSVDYKFKPNGFTMVLLLSESHASIHTYPEHKACFIDFFTCGHNCSAEKFDAALRRYLKPKRVVCEIRERK
jgi:S-adenosylmethionine decarboxylase proenzyme